MNWFATFLLLYAAGTALGAALVPSQPIGAYFFRFHGMVALAFAAVACAVGKPWTNAAAMALAGAALASAVAGRRSVHVVAAVAGLAFAVVAAKAGVLLSAHLVTAAAILGASLVAMILGHWYLVNAALSFDVLKRLTRFFVVATVAKLAVTGVYVAMDWARIWALMGEHFDGILAGVRVGVGLVGGLALALMAHACAKMRANQSATGILYVAVIMVLIGELVSIYLTLGRPEPLPL